MDPPEPGPGPEPPATPLLATDPEATLAPGGRLAGRARAPGVGQSSCPMNFHFEALGAGQRRVLQRLGEVLRRQNFYLAGGTAVALYLGHRRSQDLDWFTSEEFSDPLGLAELLGQHGIQFQTGRIEAGTLHGTISRVRVSFLSYRYSLLKPLQKWPQFECGIASLEDLTAMKLAAIAQRGSKRDFVDIYALNRKSFPFAEMLRLYQRKYSISDIGHVLVGLAYFDDANRERMPRMLWQADWETIRRTLQKRLDELV